METKVSALRKEQLDLKVVEDQMDAIFGKPDDFKVEPAVIEAANDYLPTNIFAKWLCSWTESSFRSYNASGKFDSY